MSEQVLVSTEWLAANLQRPHLRIVDIRGHVLPASAPPPHYFNHRADYDQAHIPGAVFVDWVHEITDPDDPRHAQVAKPERYAALMSRIGVGDETFVVAYDDAGGMFAARLWWSLNYYGHPRAAVLAGGWDQWVAENRPTTADIPAITPTQFVPRPDQALIRTSDQVLAGLESDQRLIDTRSAAEFAGESSRAARGGHIPTAINLPRRALLGADGRLLPAETLRRHFADAGVAPGDNVVFYCNAGVSASFGLLALRAAGISGGSVYDGSWKAWGNDPAKPIE
ncbi:MAG: sulfurtransferase [Chloroflexi bacterium]|nr:sulfurtransferase [Chloroflexota bacterium]